MIEESQIFWDKGPLNLNTNQRFINHLQLNVVTPETIAHLVVPNDNSKEGKYPVEKITGYNWSKFIDSNEYKTDKEEVVQITNHDKLSVAIQILEQMQLLLTKYGIVIADRNGGNIIIVPQEKGSQGNKWQVKHIDLAIVYDAVEDTNFISKSVDISARPSQQDQLVYKDKSRLSMWLSTNIMIILSKITFSRMYNSLEPDKKIIIDEFKKKWKMNGLATDYSKSIDIEEGLTFLKSLF